MSDDNYTSSVHDMDWVHYSSREEWEDVEVIEQDDGPHPVVAIPYSEKFSDVYDHFRGILKTQEKSERVLELTKDALELNPANYTVWQYRRDVLFHLKKDLKEELKYSRSMIEANDKNYQVWHHRKILVEILQDPSQELKLTEIILASDAKNYHAWRYRQWVIKTFNLFDKELEFVEQLLLEDVKNNSVWNQRYFVIKSTTGFNDNVVKKEIDFTIEKITLDSNNESAWNYLRGIMSHAVDSNLHEFVCKFCEDSYTQGKRSPYLLGYIVDLCEELANTGNGFFTNEQAVHICEELANEYDTIRCNYWNITSEKFSSRIKTQQQRNPKEEIQETLHNS